MPLCPNQHPTRKNRQFIHQPSLYQRGCDRAAAFAEDAGKAFLREGLEGGLQVEVAVGFLDLDQGGSGGLPCAFCGFGR